MPAFNVEMCSSAMVMVGAAPLHNVGDDEPTAIMAEQLYAEVVRELIGGYRWRFAVKLVELERLSVAPLVKWEAIYQLPANTENVFALWVGASGDTAEYDRFERFVYCNATASERVYAEVGHVPSEAYWPSYFRTLVVQTLAARFAVPIAEDLNKADYWEKMSRVQFAKARSYDSQNRTASRIRGAGGLARYHGGQP
jgi:hypothetical protein